MIDFQKLANDYGTPLYVYDAVEIRERIRRAREVFKGFNAGIVFALKANGNPALLKIMAQEGVGADVVSKGELLAAKMAGMKTIVWNGNGKCSSEREHFTNKGINYVSIDSFEELPLWDGVEIIKLLRVNPDVDARTHPHISTGLKSHKFGVPIEKIDRVADRIDGLHVHIGSQITEVAPFLDAYSKVLDCAKKYGFKYINLGGGWGIDYSGDSLDIEALKSGITALFSDYDGKLISELGRFIVGPAGYLVAGVVSVKHSDKVFVVTDAGMNTLIRPVLYDAHHRIRVLNGTGKTVTADVVGPLCESGDILARDRRLEIPIPGSAIVFENAGAYGFSMASNYNGMPLPAEILVDGKEVKLIRKRQSIEELFVNVKI
ncbi:MAG TPA: diaminopimelate decarboxylase [Mesotoga infera]|jgi:diaminopimelate decarboxylase|uniref:Diaminopimelate decarboxylase n=1 Tax=Mesotoga infera TaxID=1236046 RepID=A0A7Z7LCF2_9BACT|nr:diaminopimelate decarboxylase [Mesotoga infera]MBP8661461.1 diaminopimelate decarboxylase [Mesotoga sp.]NLI07107.1 diaminopimelate decarboxylase [Thermotogaceae bacterium]SSC11495.1 Diaminopimelate decarboxylase [Mesotoga infera]HNS66181.1 diaminopimelate decarboxylase [Mesotoga infera]HOI33917.1 diaminopimelate decarboxylase [Mesotoga infera]